MDSNACGPNRCGLDVYADDGTGYKKAMDSKYTGTAIHVSRETGEVLLFVERSDSSINVGQQEWILKGNKFLFKPHPHPRDCCGPALNHHPPKRQ